ncbi:hypothetical protein U3A58_17345 [Algoriphagus sp. C2-6-M1]|uniref:hypothetical protein n=1 Tax=Algoriphagus persicinus TaxID=3108754 RepID=UPI002B3C13AA|nr:hypothetical protein [Algoriphagus sp. C2-6-M1]MEB2782161.1 hypothetical protein [Algoriphagus sp. C2-6-M1]
MEVSILKGLRNAFTENIELRGFDYANLKPEYLLKYKIATQIKSDFPDYKIELEARTEKFHQRSYEIGDFMTEPSFYNKWGIERSGFIDIAIYNSDFKAICPIEVKLINPQIILVEEDLIRLLDYLKAFDRSSIEGAYFVYIYKKKVFESLEQKQKDIDSAKVKAKNMICNFSHEIKSRLEYDFFCESIGEFTNFETNDEMEGLDQFELGELIRENFHYVGVVIKIRIV